MGSTIRKCAIYIIIAVAICLILNIILSSVIPIISNDIAMGQLTNDNYDWFVSVNWLNNINMAIAGLKILVMFICLLKCILTVNNYNKNRKGNENE